jgi:hypothetical protein
LGGRRDGDDGPGIGRPELPIFDTVLTGKSVIGSLLGTRNHLADCFALNARGLTKVVAERRQLEDVGSGLLSDRLALVPSETGPSSRWPTQFGGGRPPWPRSDWGWKATETQE